MKITVMGATGESGKNDAGRETVAASRGASAGLLDRGNSVRGIITGRQD